MDASWFLLVLSAAILISLVLLLIVCLNCWNKGPMVSISQTNESEEYIPSTQFRVIHPHHPSSDIRSTCHLLPPQQVVSPSSDLRIPGRRPLTPTDNESNPSYENPTKAYSATDLHDSDVEDPGYIIVIPDDEAPARASASRASTTSSDNQHEYVNLGGDDEEQEDEQEDESNDEQDYQNVDPKNSLTAHSITSALSRSRPSSREVGPTVNDATSESESSDDETGNYVNQPPMIHS